MTTYTDNQSLHDDSTKQTLEKQLIVDIISLCELVHQIEVQIVWPENDKEISDVLKK